MRQESQSGQLADRFTYPPAPSSRPVFDIVDGAYRCRFARDHDDLQEVLRLRYRVFNLELGEGLETSHALGLDLDDFDAQCHHLMVIHEPTARIVGTYRMQTIEMARTGRGLYSADEFDFSGWPADVIARSCEVGRACIEAEHRHRRVLLLLWRGLGSYVVHNRKRYLFGCCSLTSQDPIEAARMREYLLRHGHVHPTLDLQPQPDFDCAEQDLPTEGWEQVHVPTLFRTYLRYGAWICGRPAIDRQFKTIDFLALLDLEDLDPEFILRQFEVDLRQLR